MQKLLQKHGVTDSGAAGGRVGRKERMAAERAQLAAAMGRHAGLPDMLERIADELTGVVTVKQVRGGWGGNRTGQRDDRGGKSAQGRGGKEGGRRAGQRGAGRVFKVYEPACLVQRSFDVQWGARVCM